MQPLQLACDWSFTLCLSNWSILNTRVCEAQLCSCIRGEWWVQMRTGKPGSPKPLSSHLNPTTMWQKNRCQLVTLIWDNDLAAGLEWFYHPKMPSREQKVQFCWQDRLLPLLQRRWAGWGLEGCKYKNTQLQRQDDHWKKVLQRFIAAPITN